MAVILGRARLQARHRHLFQPEPYQPLLLRWGQLALRTVVVLLTTLAVAFLFPLLPSRRQGLPTSWNEYQQQLSAACLVATLIGIGFFREWVWKYARRQPSCRWVGQFTVLSKEPLLGNYWVWLHPGDSHRVRIAAADYQRLEKGDTVTLIYSAEYELVSVMKR